MSTLPNSEAVKSLQAQIKSKDCHVGIIGLGYVGLPLALRCSEVFEKVTGFDTDPRKVELLNSGNSYIKQIQSSRVAKATKAGFSSTVDMSLASECDALIICVPTPLTIHQEPDLSFVRMTTESLLPYLRESQILVLESTTFPGTTEDLIVPRVTAKGFNVGEDFFIVYSPEREDPGNKDFGTRTIPKIVGGHTEACLAVGSTLYEQFIDTVVPVSSTKAAEMTKLLENIHRSVNIGLVNEMKIVADKMGIDIHEVIDAAATKPFGFTKYSPGPGLGGHCIPIDPFYLTWKAKEFGISTRFIELAGEVNRDMPRWVVTKIMEALNDKCLSLNGASILVLGIAYKKNVDDARESPSIRIMELLRSKGAVVSYSDPHIPNFPKMREHQFDLSSVQITPESLADFDVVLLGTDHDDFEYDLIRDHSSILVDTRNRFKAGNNIVKA